MKVFLSQGVVLKCFLVLPPATRSPVVSWTRTEAGHRAASGQAGQLTRDSRDNTLDTPSVLYIQGVQ